MEMRATYATRAEYEADLAIYRRERAKRRAIARRCKHPAPARSDIPDTARTGEYGEEYD